MQPNTKIIKQFSIYSSAFYSQIPRLQHTAWTQMLFPGPWFTLCTWKLESLCQFRRSRPVIPQVPTLLCQSMDGRLLIRVPSVDSHTELLGSYRLRKDKIKNSLDPVLPGLYLNYNVCWTCSDLWFSESQEMKGYQGPLFFFQQKFSLFAGRYFFGPTPSYCPQK